MPRQELEEVARAVLKQIENLRVLQDASGELYFRKLLAVLRSKITPARDESLEISKPLSNDQ